MTEREKRIEEMVGIAFPIYGASYNEIIALKRLVDAGYRKEEEVQKETVKKIIKYLRENGQFTFDYPYDPVRNVHFSESIFEVLEDMFGVEVEE